MPFKAPAGHEQVPAVADAGAAGRHRRCKPGQAVQAGERLAVIEAMKMENILTATQDGTVERGAGRARARAWRSTSRSSSFA
ncbi:MAG: acetyl-CoA carboxylase biotin carboxyl carrier protein subunit [Comamonadaceae bacterium]|nr:acetyl-CoA carboxylase biotin carboxyl carrier protein subunit [Comamonadaceae bacterium]